MELLLSLVASGSIKWIAILLLSTGLGASIYIGYKKSLEAERQKALLEYNILQMQRIVKEKDEFLKKQQNINADKESIVSSLQNERDELDKRTKELELEVERLSVKDDRPSSKILKDVIKVLGKQK